LQVLQEIVEYLNRRRKSEAEIASIEVEDVGNLKIEKVKTNHPKLLKGKHIDKINIYGLEIETPTFGEASDIFPLFYEMLSYLESVDKPEESKVRKILDAIKPWGSWFDAALTILRMGGWLP